MKRLILIRHGKSSWKKNVPDEQRPLKPRAKKDANLVITAFKGIFNKPALLWSSPALRALSTAKFFKKDLEISNESFQVKKELYNFNASDVLSIIKTCPKEVEQLLVFGHNPAFTSLANTLGDTIIDNLPTSGLCAIDFEIETWKELKEGKTIVTLYPKNLR